MCALDAQSQSLTQKIKTQNYKPAQFVIPLRAHILSTGIIHRQYIASESLRAISESQLKLLKKLCRTIRPPGRIQNFETYRKRTVVCYGCNKITHFLWSVSRQPVKETFIFLPFFTGGLLPRLGSSITSPDCASYPGLHRRN